MTESYDQSPQKNINIHNTTMKEDWNKLVQDKETPFSTPAKNKSVNIEDQAVVSPAKNELT